MKTPGNNFKIYPPKKDNCARSTGNHAAGIIFYVNEQFPPSDDAGTSSAEPAVELVQPGVDLGVPHGIRLGLAPASFGDGSLWLVVVISASSPY